MVDKLQKHAFELDWSEVSFTYLEILLKSCLDINGFQFDSKYESSLCEVVSLEFLPSYTWIALIPRVKSTHPFIFGGTLTITSLANLKIHWTMLPHRIYEESYEAKTAIVDEWNLIPSDIMEKIRSRKEVELWWTRTAIDTTYRVSGEKKFNLDGPVGTLVLLERSKKTEKSDWQSYSPDLNPIEIVFIDEEKFNLDGPDGTLVLLERSKKIENHIKELEMKLTSRNQRLSHLFQQDNANTAKFEYAGMAIPISRSIFFPGPYPKRNLDIPTGFCSRSQNKHRSSLVDGQFSSIYHEFGIARLVAGPQSA
ncbi:unnamed protein product [Caenorhabditis nigoni]